GFDLECFNYPAGRPFSHSTYDGQFDDGAVRFMRQGLVDGENGVVVRHVGLWRVGAASSSKRNPPTATAAQTLVRLLRQMAVKANSASAGSPRNPWDCESSYYAVAAESAQIVVNYVKE